MVAQRIDETRSAIVREGGVATRRRRGPGLTGAQREALWRRYKSGETIARIARGLENVTPTIHRELTTWCDTAPTARTRSARALRLLAREKIS